MTCDIDIRKDAYTNVVLSSGTDIFFHRVCFIYDVFKVVAVVPASFLSKKPSDPRHFFPASQSVTSLSAWIVHRCRGQVAQ